MIRSFVRTAVAASLAIHLQVAPSPFTSTSLSAQGIADVREDPEHVFQVFWETFDARYGIFGPKRVDWEALYRVYRPLITPRTTDDELFDVLCRLIEHLDDNHLYVAREEGRCLSGIAARLDGQAFRSGEMEDFSISLIEQDYLTGPLRERGIFHHGWLPDSIAYLRIQGFGGLDTVEEDIDRVMQDRAGARGFVIDLRATPGGDDRVARAIASRFADERRLYMRTYARNGPRHEDFDPPVDWFVEPAGPWTFTGPVAVLTHRWAFSAAENFALAMRVLPHATQIGDFTSGVMADVFREELPNGWRFTVSYKRFEDPSGFCWEGIGIPPDLTIRNRPQDLAQGVDRVLDFALAFLAQQREGSVSAVRNQP